MAGRHSDRVDAWTDRIDHLCDAGETVEHRVDLESATLVVTNRRLLSFTPDLDGRNFRGVDRPNVGTVTVESTDRLAWLFLSLLAAFVGIGLLEATSAVSVGDSVPVDPPAVPTITPVAGLLAAVSEGIEIALLVLEWGVLALSVAALVLAAVLLGAYVRSRSRRLVMRISGEADLAVPITNAEVEAGVVADLEAAIRPGPPDGNGVGRGGTADGPAPAAGDGPRPEESG